MRSRKTTLAGVLAGLGLLLNIGARFVEDPTAALATLDTETVGTIVAAFGAILTGVYARDDNVTSEGTPAENRRRFPL
jgi:hypothetical protein